MYRHKPVSELTSLKRCINNVLFHIQDPNWLHSQQSQWKFDWIDFFTFPIYSQYSYLEYKYSYFPHLIGLTSVDPVRGRYRINRFSQHEIVADLIYQRHKFCILNFTANSSVRIICGKRKSRQRGENPYDQRMIKYQENCWERILTFGFSTRFTECSELVGPFKPLWDSGQ